MSLETYLKAGIISGIVLVSCTIVFGILPDFVNRYDYFRQHSISTISEEDVKKKYYESPEFQAFAERFPDHEVEFWYGNNESRFGMVSYNPDTKNALILNMRYDVWSENMNKDVQCSTTKLVSGNRYNADGLMVIPFIKSTECLD